jgi:hypothetical protein
MSILMHRDRHFWNRRTLLRRAVTTFSLEEDPHEEAGAKDPDNGGKVTEHC